MIKAIVKSTDGVSMVEIDSIKDSHTLLGYVGDGKNNDPVGMCINTAICSVCGEPLEMLDNGIAACKNNHPVLGLRRHWNFTDDQLSSGSLFGTHEVNMQPIPVAVASQHPSSVEFYDASTQVTLKVKNCVLSPNDGKDGVRIVAPGLSIPVGSILGEASDVVATVISPLNDCISVSVDHLRVESEPGQELVVECLDLSWYSGMRLAEMYEAGCLNDVTVFFTFTLPTKATLHRLPG